MPWLALACWELGWGKPDRESSSLRHSDKFLESPGLLLLLFKLLCCWEREAGGDPISPSYYAVGRGKLGGIPFPQLQLLPAPCRLVFSKDILLSSLLAQTKGILTPLQNGPRNFSKGLHLVPFLSAGGTH